MSNTKKLILILIGIVCLIICLCSIVIKYIPQTPKQEHRVVEPITDIDSSEKQKISREVRPNITHKDKNFIKFSTGENFIELRYSYTNAVVGDCAVFPAAFVPEPSSYPDVKMSEIYANASKQEEVEDRIREVCLAMYGNVEYHQARLYFSKDNNIVYIEGYEWNNPNKLSEWKYDNGELKKTNF